MKIPVSTAAAMLPDEETTLAILKARLQAMSPTNRWYPVLQRYIGYVAGRIDGLGGNADQIPPSFNGAPIAILTGGEGGRSPEREREFRYTGKVAGLIFDHFGDFEGFLLDTSEHERGFRSREQDVRDLAERAWRERLRITVYAEGDEPHRIRTIIVHEPPATMR